MAIKLVGTATHASTFRSLLLLALSTTCAADYTACDDMPEDVLKGYIKLGHCMTTTPRALPTATQAQAQTGTNKPKPNPGAIIGGVVGGAAGVATLAAGAGALAVSLQNYLKPPVTHKDTNAKGISFEKHGPTTTLKWGKALPIKENSISTTLNFQRHPELTTTTLGKYVPQVLGMLRAKAAPETVSKLQAPPGVKARKADQETRSSSQSSTDALSITVFVAALCVACLLVGLCVHMMCRRQKKRRKDYEAPDSARAFSHRTDAEEQEYEDDEVHAVDLFPDYSGMPNILSPFMVTAPTVSRETLQQQPSYTPPVAGYSYAQPTFATAPVHYIQPANQAPQAAQPLAPAVLFETAQQQWQVQPQVQPQTQMQQPRVLETFERAVPLVAETGVVPLVAETGVAQNPSFQSSFYSRAESATLAGYAASPQSGYPSLTHASPELPTRQAVTYEVPVVAEPGIDLGLSFSALPGPAQTSRPVELVAAPPSMPLPNRGGNGFLNPAEVGLSLAAPPFQANQVMPARLNFG